jgi:hypothetical protein
MADEPKPKTGLDDVLSLEATYYATPIPQSMSVLTILGAVFDKVYFPGVMMPIDNFDQEELDKEIGRIEGLNVGLNVARRPNDILLPMLKFIRHAKTLQGFCIFTGDPEKPFDNPQQISDKMVHELYDAIHGPLPPGFIPEFSTNWHKGLPGSDEAITYPGTYHYLAGAVRYSAQTGIPLLNDLPGLPIPGLDGSVPVDDAKTLAAIIAIECTKLVLPELPILRPEDLMEFRAENTATLRAFRRSMLRYADDLNKRLSGIKQEELEKHTKFFIHTEIVPVLDELQAAINAPARAWWRRGLDFVKVVPELATGAFTMEPTAAIAKVLTTYAGQMFAEITARGDQREALKRSGLYYLLRLRAFQAERKP